jgi:hypothetical protein
MKGRNTMPNVTEAEYQAIAEKVGLEKMKAAEQASGESTGLLDVPDKTPKSCKKGMPVKQTLNITCTKEDFLKALQEQSHLVSDYNRIKFGEPDYVLVDHKHVEAQSEQLVTLHQEVVGYMQRSFELAVQIGEILVNLKANHIQKGKFGLWMEQQHLPFSNRTGQRYMQIYVFREELAKKNIQTITEAYREIQGEAQDSEVIEINDSTTIQSTWDMVDAKQDVDNFKLPAKKLKGIEEKIQINSEIVERMENSKYPFEGKYAKFVVTIPSNEAQKSLLPRFIIAASSLLMVGGKLIFVKR